MSEGAFRRLTSDDTEALTAAFIRNDVDEVTSTFDPFPLSPSTARDLLDPRRGDRFFGAFRDDTLIAFSMLRGRDEGYEVPSFGIFVDKDEQGRGLGSGLTAWTLERAREAGAPAVRLSVYASNPGAVRIYERLGFVVHSREAVTRRGATDERIVMVKSFSEPR
jgi:ribosomal protein S18 acetylase RimI-like enzyme